METVSVLGVKVNNITKKQAKAKVVEFLNSPAQYKIFTPNPEMVVRAQKDGYFKEVLNTGDLNLCDGFGLWLAIRLSFRPKRSEVEKSLSHQSARDPSTAVGMTVERIHGVDFVIEVCKLAAEQGKGVYLLGSGDDEIVKKAAEELQKRFPGLKIAGYDKGPGVSDVCHPEGSSPKGSLSQLSFSPQRESSQLDTGSPIKSGMTPSQTEILHSVQNDSIVKINAVKPSIIFVAFGMGKQEKWIHENLAKIPSVKIAMGVGGSFEFISGKIKRAPVLLRKLGLEWMYRLWQQPKRLIRIWNATAVFTWKVLKEKMYESSK